MNTVPTGSGSGSGSGSATLLVALAKEVSPDIILLPETWCNCTVDAVLAISGYILATDLTKDRVDTANGIGGGGRGF